MNESSILNQERSISQKDFFGLVDFIVVLFGAIMLFTLFSEVNPLSSTINRALVGIYLISAVAELCIVMKKRTLVTLILLAFVEAVTIANTDGAPYNLNDILYLPMWVITLLFMTERYELVKKTVAKYHSLLKIVGLLWLFFTVLSIPFSSSYSYVGNMRSFVSFTGTSHRFAATCLFACCCFLIEYCVTKAKSNLLLMLTAVAFIFSTNTRTYIIVVLVVVMFCFLKFGGSIGFKRLVFILGALGIAAIAYYLAMAKVEMEANAWALKNRGVMYVITSGRSTFWQAEIQQFFSEDILSMAFGKGLNYVYDVNLLYMGVKIWAHNDYLNVLLANGFLGVAIYLYVFFLFLNKVKKTSDYRLIFGLMFVFAIFFNAMFNMVYTYTVASFVTPLLGMIMIDTEYFLHFRNSSRIKV